MRCREAQSAVSYPAEFDDEFIVDDPEDATAIATRQPNGKLCFLTGWNYTTDLYRVLQYAVDQFRKRRVGGATSLGTLLDLSATSTSPQTVLDLVGVMYSNLPSRFKETRNIGDLVEDRFNFQTANIIATMQLLRMVVLGVELEEASGEKRCQVAGELLDAIATIPTTYLRALSSPLVSRASLLMERAGLTYRPNSSFISLVLATFWGLSLKASHNPRFGRFGISCEWDCTLWIN
jgi:hypothetical protein